MGVGSPEDIVKCVDRGIDIFDSALPTQIARRGALITWQGRHHIRKAVYSQIKEPIDPSCDCYTCCHFSVAYLNHLFRCEELLAYRLATIHNLRFMHSLMNKIRESITNGTFITFRDGFLASYQPTDEKLRLDQKQGWLETRHNNRISEGQ